MIEHRLKKRNKDHRDQIWFFGKIVYNKLSFMEVDGKVKKKKIDNYILFLLL